MNFISAPIADAFELDTLNRELAGTPFAGRVRHFPTIDSTNTLGHARGRTGAGERHRLPC